MTPLATHLSGYQLRLPAFEGPLDVLLQLIERDQLEISAVSLVTVTGGFLDHIAAMVDPEPSLLADFLGIAARLLLLKSRSLLPRRTTDELDDDADDLVSQLREYQVAKRSAALFRERENAGWRSHPRPLTPVNGEINVIVIAPPPGQLRRALLRAVARVRHEPTIARLTPRVSIGEMIERLKVELQRAVRPFHFRQFVGASSREDTVAGFIALLALWRRGELTARQEHPFDEIWIERPAPALPVFE